MARMIRLYEFRGCRYLLRELANLSGIGINTLRARLNDGWTLEQALCTPTPKQRKAGVVSNFEGSTGTGGGSTAQEIPNINFSKED